jgi:hypothetical protein
MRTRALGVLLVVFAVAVAAPTAAHGGPGHPPPPGGGFGHPGYGGGYGHPGHWGGYGHPGYWGGYHYPNGYWGVNVGWGWGPYWGWGGWWGPGWGWGPYWGYGAPVGYQAVPVGGTAPELAVVDTDVEPEQARVLLDGTLIGVADNFDGYPDYLYLKPGHYTIDFQLQGYASQKVEIDAQPGGYFPIKFKLERIKGEKAAPWYDRPEGMPIGRVFGPKTPPASVPPVSAPPPGPDTSLRPEFHAPAASAAARSAAGAALDLRVSPLNAAVYIDGNLVGTGQELSRLERGLAVTPGRHVIEVLAPGRASKTVDVELKEGERQQVVIDLDAGPGQTS